MMNDLTTLDLDLQIVPGSYAPNYEMAKMSMTMELYEKGIVDPSVVIDHLPFENRDELKARYDTIQQQQDYIAQLENALEEMSGQNKSLSDKMTSVQIDTKVKEGELQVKKIVDDERGKARINNKMGNLKVKEILADTKMKARKFLAGLEAQQKQQSPGQSEMPVTSQDILINEIIAAIGG